MIDEENMDRDTARALYRALDLTNLGVIAPHKEKYYLRYDINWLINHRNYHTRIEFFVLALKVLIS